MSPLASGLNPSGSLFSVQIIVPVEPVYKLPLFEPSIIHLLIMPPVPSICHLLTSVSNMFPSHLWTRYPEQPPEQLSQSPTRNQWAILGDTQILDNMVYAL